MEKDNSKVPVAILSCFLIAFILQGVLKISGVFIFEKALNWEIFKIIDNNKILQINFYSITNLINVYSLSFCLSSNFYSKRLFNNLFLVIGTYSVTICRLLLQTPDWVEYVYDLILYIIIPIINSMTIEKEYRAFDKKFNDFINTISIHILLYFFYLGLGYWSGLTSSIIVKTQTILFASSMLLVQLERYLGIVLLMLSLNICIKKLKRKEV